MRASELCSAWPPQCIQVSILSIGKWCYDLVRFVAIIHANVITETSMQSSLQQHIARQREMLKEFLRGGMAELAGRLAQHIGDPTQLDRQLASHIENSTYCKYLWVLDNSAHQLSATISRQGLLETERHRDRAARPYMQRALMGERFYLSDAYLSRNRKRPSLTSVQTIVDADGKPVGYLGADFDLRNLPYTANLNLDRKVWQQLKGDPAIRGGLFAQQRVVSAMDEKIDDILSLVEEMMVAHGVFHAKFHFSSSRATLWLVDNPYDYQVLNIDELTDPAVCLAFRKRRYFSRARVPREDIARVFAQFKKLRFADENIYLRSASLNIVNTIVGLNFSCDGSHYVPYDIFLEKDNSFWFGVR